MTSPNPSLIDKRLADLTLQRDSARDLALILEEANERALRLHQPARGLPCPTCRVTAPCPTASVLTGLDDEDEVA